MEQKKPYVKPEIKFFPAGSPQFTAIMRVLNSEPVHQPTQKQGGSPCTKLTPLSNSKSCNT